MNTVTLGGTATINDLVSVARFGAKVAFSKEYEERVNHCRAHVDRFSHEGKAIYGLTTGLGDNWKKFIPEKDRETIQRNNIYAHTCAVGEPIAEECTRAMMFVMLCHFGSGHTGIRLETLALIRDMLNAGISPVVPGHGSVGYLTLEGHIGMVMIGEGKATYQGETLDGAEALKRAGLKPVVLSSKEGLILLSGTTSVTAFASLAIYDAQTLSLTADIAGSFTLEVLKGTLMAMDERLMAVRPHPDQINTAANIRAILKDSPMLERYRGHRVQDALSIRCMPKLHGPVKKAVKDAQATLAIELNSSVDNPLIFDEEDGGAVALMGCNAAKRPMTRCTSPSISSPPSSSATVRRSTAMRISAAPRARRLSTTCSAARFPRWTTTCPSRHISRPSPSRSSTARISEPWKQASAR